ncbi:MAG: NAD-dependent epimerase/dehydratase family protein [Gaiellaceae bacterium]
MKLLVFGGTKFLGRAVVEAALARGHEVTLFNRGETNPGLFSEAEKLRGDRDGDLAALEGREWDAVVDPSGYVPRVVGASASLLADAVEHYVFVSSVSVYDPPLAAGFDETASVIELEDPATETIAEAYGGLKALCERTVEGIFPGRAAHVRAGLIVGPHDPTDRFTYWPVRAARGGEILAPGNPDRQWQFVDARDLGAWLVLLAEKRTAGVFNATGPLPATTAREVLETCLRTATADGRLTWVDDAFLVEHEVGAWMELPLWIPEGDDFASMQEANASRALAAGLVFRPVEETVSDTLAWADGRNGAVVDGVGLTPERERDLLAAWHGRVAA